jgi:hypothetical protein
VYCVGDGGEVERVEKVSGSEEEARRTYQSVDGKEAKILFHLGKVVMESGGDELKKRLKKKAKEDFKT